MLTALRVAVNESFQAGIFPNVILSPSEYEATMNFLAETRRCLIDNFYINLMLYQGESDYFLYSHCTALFPGNPPGFRVNHPAGLLQVGLKRSLV